MSAVRPSLCFPSSFVLPVFIVFLWVTTSPATVTVAGKNTSVNGVINVKNKFSGRRQPLDVLKAHDSRRQFRFFPGVDIPLGGTGRPDAVGLYFAKIGIGTPSRDYYVQVDTGSNIIWVNCIQCTECPTKGSFGIELTLYDVKESLTGNLVSCAEDICSVINGGPVPDCTASKTCPYSEMYGDGSFTTGYLVQDVVQYDRVSGDLETISGNESIIFGCGARQSGNVDSSDEALDGILGFGNSNSSMISQLASSGKVKKIFAHCLDSINGGGIFAIGHVVLPEVDTTPLVRNQPNYSVNMTAIEVGGHFLNLTTNIFEAGKNKGTIIDSGTTLAYLPEVVYEPLLKKIISHQSDLNVQTIHDQYTCFKYSESVDDGFPLVTFHFENSLSLKVHPHEYLFSIDDLWCIGWQNNGLQSRNLKDMTLLGDLVLSNKLVIYDLENQVMGWTEYNCSASIEIKDEQTGAVHMVGYHYISCGRSMIVPRMVIFWFLAALLYSQAQ